VFFLQKTAYEMLRSLVGSEMCIRYRLGRHVTGKMSVSSVTMGSHGSPQAAKKVDRMARVAAAFLGMMGQRMRALRMATMNMHHRAVCTTDAPMSGGGVPRFVCGPLTT